MTTDVTNATKLTNGTPRTGAFSYLIGSRTLNEPVGGGSKVLTRTIRVPATSPGVLTFRWRPEGWDSSAFDNLTVEIIGTTTQEILGPGYGNYATAPFSPNFGGSPATTSAPGYGVYNGFDMTTSGTHTQGMTMAYGSEIWFTRSISLSPFAGQTVTLRFTAGQVETYKSWFHIDDIEWSLTTGTIGNAEGFGVNITQPASGGQIGAGTIGITAVVDAAPTAPTTATNSPRRTMSVTSLSAGGAGGADQ